MSQIAFQEFPKIARLNREVIITEKIDGTNAQVYVRPAESPGEPFEVDYDTIVNLAGSVSGPPAIYLVRAGSRTRWLTHGGSGDNFGFGMWVYQHANQLAQGLGYGHHFGEWWGSGIQRNYGQKIKRFSLFHVPKGALKPDCCDVVPVLYQGLDMQYGVVRATDCLRKLGSYAAPGFMKPEGMVVFHTASRQLFKVTLEKDEEHKSQQKVAA